MLSFVKEFARGFVKGFWGAFGIKVDTVQETHEEFNKWWHGHNITVNGYRGKFYKWPVDRLICLDRQPDKKIGIWFRNKMDVIEEGQTALLPTFTLSQSMYDDIYDCAHQAVMSALVLGIATPQNCFVSIFKIENSIMPGIGTERRKEDWYAIAVTSFPAEVTTRF